MRGASRTLVAIALTLACACIASSRATAADTTAVKLEGNPLSVYVGPRGQCQSSYVVDGNVEGNFYPGGSPATFGPVADCGLFLAFPSAGEGQPMALDGKTFGFQPNAPAPSFDLYEPVSQSAVSGDGSPGDPYAQTTVFEVVDSAKGKDALVTETTTYVNGAAQFTSSYDVKNVSAGKLYFRAIYAGDLFVNGDDHGTGVYLGGPPRFVGGQNAAAGILGGLQETSGSELPWSAFEELAYPAVWDTIAESDERETAFAGAIEANGVDDAVGVEWDQFRSGNGLPSGAEQAFSIVNRTQIPSALVVQPVTQSQTVGQTATITVTATDNVGTPYANRPIVYTTGTANPKTGSVLTNSAGVAKIGYVGTAAGLDTMQMFLDLAGTGTRTGQDPASAAQITWTPAPPTPNGSYKIQSLKANSNGTITIVLVPKQDGTALVQVTVPTATISGRAAIAAKAKTKAKAKAKKCKRSQVALEGQCRAKTTISGKLSAAGKAGVPLKLTIKPSRKVEKALSTGKKVQLTAKLTYKSKLGGTPTVQTFHLTVAAKNKHKQHH
jgi:hypothetical protein